MLALAITDLHVILPWTWCSKMKILVFLHGTLIMHSAGVGCSRQERVAQVEQNAPSVFEYKSYVPVGSALRKIRDWEAQGAKILYFSSHTDAFNIRKDQSVLDRFEFPGTEIYYRLTGESYKDVAQRVKPDVLIEDDCESIGGEIEMTYPHLDPSFKDKIKSVVIKEFEGIDHLPSDLGELLMYEEGV